NYIYYKSAIKNITKIKEKLIDTDKQRIEIDKSAGTLIDWIQTLPKTVRETTFPILIAIITFLFTLTFMDLRCSKNIEYQLTDVTKFAIKDHKEPKTGDDPSEWLDSEIMILGISETSQFQYLNRIYGQFPWPRETYADFLSYFRLDDERLQIPQDQLDEIKFLTWNSINPQIVFFDIFFDAPRNTSISYEKRSLQNDFGKLINMLEKLNKPEKKQKTTSVKNKNKIKKSKKQFAKKPLKLDYKTILKTTILDWANEKKNESDQKFFDELKRQKNKNYIFVDYPLASEKEGRLEEDTVKIGYSFLSKWELKNVFDRYGKKINVPKTEHDIIDYPPIAYDIKAPLVNITKNIAGAGAANILQDPDGKRRRMPLIYRIYDERIMVEPVFVPTVGLIMAMKYYNIEPKDIIVKLGSSIVLNNATLKKRINYTRKGKDKVYNWTEFIDPFMDIIIKDIISMANSTGTTSGDFKLNYETLFKRLLNNKILENSLIEKFKKNNLEINVTKELFKREINDFLNSLSITAFFKQNDFFQVEDKNFKKIDTSKLKKYYDTFDKEHKILKNLVEKKIVQKEDLSREAKILFLGTEEAKISYKDIRYEKGGFYATVAQLVSGNISLKPEELNQVLQDLINKNYITPLNENDYKIVNIDELEKYKASLNDEKVKSIIDYLISSLELPFISKELQNKKLITFNEEKGNFFTVSDINSLKDFHKKIPSKNNEEKVIIQYIIDWMGFGDATINANDMYRELETQFKINPAKSKNVIENLIKNNLISFPSYVFFEIPNLKKLHEYKDSFIKRIFHRKIINKMIETADRIIEIAGIGGKYYSLKTETVLNYINSKTGISKKEIREILHKIKIDKKIDKKFKSIRILINPKEVKDEEVKIEDYEEIIKYYQHVNNKNQIFNALLMLSKDKSESLPYQKTLLDISRLTNIYPRVVLYIIREIIDNKIIEIEHLKEDKRIIKANL
ncbi:MAG: CHASE2 domain-containing protein, partial [Spirochaetota bacterium]|nr:CHASE2 domain-containing protein [Spirochaetota bacterium]